MKWCVDDGNCEVEIEADSAVEAAREYVESGDWGEHESTVWINVWVWPADGDEDEDRESYKIELHPDPPPCVDGSALPEDEDHDWHAPHEIVGGLKENPGVWAHGGGVMGTLVCRRCGLLKHWDSWAQDPEDGTQGLDSVRYEKPDAK